MRAPVLCEQIWCTLIAPCVKSLNPLSRKFFVKIYYFIFFEDAAAQTVVAASLGGCSIVAVSSARFNTKIHARRVLYILSSPYSFYFLSTAAAICIVNSWRREISTVTPFYWFSYVALRSNSSPSLTICRQIKLPNYIFIMVKPGKDVPKNEVLFFQSSIYYFIDLEESVNIFRFIFECRWRWTNPW